VQDYLNGKEKALQAIIGKVMAKTRGSANAAEAKNIIISIINEKKDVAKN
jgi:Asp-tRNA(Asn)/Glu-tRNA(Gln) amidotransferase B subunit